MKYTVEQTFCNVKHECLGWSYQRYDDVFKGLIYQMIDKINHPFIGELYRDSKILMNLPFYSEFIKECKASGHDSDTYRGIRIILDPTLHIGDSKSPYGIVRLVYEEPGVNVYSKYCVESAKATYECYTGLIKKCTNQYYLSEFKAKPHIDHVKFNGPATIVFWKDGTKTVVKHDGKGRKDKRLAILYAFIRKIYGEGKAYHKIITEIEEAVK